MTTTPQPPDAPPAAPQPPPVAVVGPTPLELLFRPRTKDDLERFLRVKAYVTVVASRRAPAREVQDLVAKTLERAVKQQRKGVHWDPAKQTAQAYLVAILYGVLKDGRRTNKRKPETELPKNFEAVSEAATVQATLMEEQQVDETEEHASKVLERLAKQKKGPLAVQIVSLMRDGMRGQQNIADALGCSLEDVRNAVRRVRHHVGIVDVEPEQEEQA